MRGGFSFGWLTAMAEFYSITARGSTVGLMVHKTPEFHDRGTKPNSGSHD
jgi:hypothetical protein